MSLWWIIPGIVTVGSLLVWLIWVNQRDRRRFTKQLNRNYRKPKEQEKDTDIEEQMRAEAKHF